MNRYFKLRTLLPAILFVFITKTNYAQQRENFTQFITGNNITDSTSLRIIDDKFQDSVQWHVIDVTYEVQDKVYFEINPDTNLSMPVPFGCDLDLEVKKWDADNNLTIEYKTLHIDYDTSKGSVYTRKSYFVTNGAHKIDVNVQRISYDDSSGSYSPPPLFRLGSEMSITRSYEFDCSELPSMIYGELPNKRIKFLFSYLSGATNLDFEWTFYDFNSKVYSQFDLDHSSFNPDWFKNNCTRATINKYDYDISEVYPKGFLFFRVRYVKVLPDGKRIEGDWNYNELFTGEPAYFFIEKDHMEDKLNWQYSASFAEEGKVKELVSYYDGTLRDRQNTGRSNSDFETIVSETIYDHEGRPAVNVMPSPTESDILMYYDKFNTDLSGNAYTSNLFDFEGCTLITPKMGTSSGASKYYSTGNSHHATGFNRFLPDANGYPFAVTKYSGDHTGRIIKQGGVGDQLTLLDLNHFTSYMYAKPAQEELNFLFGNDAGDANHYTKDLTIDPNGQISVAYKDETGKTIATALTGATPKNLIALPSNPEENLQNINIDILSNLTRTGDSLFSEYVYPNEVSGNVVTISYNFHPTTYSDECTPEICYDCLYLMSLRVVDDCGNFINDTTTHVNFSYGSPYNTDCSDPDGFSVTQQITLPDIATYHFIKVLKVNRDALNYYTNQFMLHNTCIPTLDQFVQNAIGRINFGDCAMTCEQCSTSAGTLAEFRDHYLLEIGTANYSQSDADHLYNLVLQHCADLCRNNSPCESYKQALLSDVTPGGQYATFSKSGGSYSCVDPASVFYITTTSAPYQGVSYSSMATINGVTFNPATLPLAEFLHAWKPEWASDLLYLHPEYCKLLFCEQNEASQLYDREMMSIDNFDDACTQGFLDPVGNIPSSLAAVCSSATHLDPFFQSGGAGYSHLHTSGGILGMSEYLNENPDVQSTSGVALDEWQLATYISIVATISDCNLIPEPNDPVHPIPESPASSCIGDKNMMWQLFKSLYIAKKNALFQTVKDAWLTTSHCSPGIVPPCIGCNVTAVHPYISCSPCSTKYTNKIPRFLDSPPGSLTSMPVCSACTSKCGWWDYYHSQSLVTATALNCSTSCTTQADDIINGLITWAAGNCTTCSTHTSTDAASNALRTDLISICEAGCDANHPWGSSNGNGGTGSTTFHDAVVSHYGSDYGTGIDQFHFPPPYDHPLPPNQIANIPVLQPTAEQITCICNRMGELGLNGLPSAQAYTILTGVYDTHITYGEFLDLLGICQNPPCLTFSHAFQVPSILQCENCKSCSEVYAAYNQIFAEDPTITTMDGWQGIISGYLNNQFQFHYTYADYIKFMTDCGNPVPCNLVHSLVDDYAALTTPKPPIVLWLNMQLGLQYTLNDYQVACDIGAHSLYTEASCDDIATAYGLFMAQPGAVTLQDPMAEMYRFFITNYWNVSLFSGSPNAYSVFLDKIAACNLPVISPTYPVECSEFLNAVSDYVSGSVNIPIALYLNHTLGIHFFTLEQYENWYRYCHGGDDLPASNITFSCPGSCTKLEYAMTDFLAYVQVQSAHLTLDSAASFFAHSYWTQFTAHDIRDLLTHISSGSPCGCLGGSFTNINLLNSLLSEECSNIASAYSSYFSQHLTIPLADYLNSSINYSFTLEQYLPLLSLCIYDFHNPGETKQLCATTMFAFAAPETTDCVDFLIHAAIVNATDTYHQLLESTAQEFRGNYLSHCLNSLGETFRMDTKFAEYHFTLYYYDQAENLVMTVPPEGVAQFFHANFPFPSWQNDQIDLARKDPVTYGYGAYYTLDYYTNTNGGTNNYATKYFYNSFNKVYRQESPDGGITLFWYDNIGRLILSQNSKQALNYLASYTLYDNLGRISEVGEINNVYNYDEASMDAIISPYSTFVSFITDPSNTRTQVTHTYYDEQLSTAYTQENLINRVAAVTYEDVDDGDRLTYLTASHYDYDIDGNVRTVHQENRQLVSVGDNKDKRVDYDYDLISGKVNKVAYQDGAHDQFTHYYSYDSDNRLTDAFTSDDATGKVHDANYQYYRHGPLAKTILGDLKVQGIDYAYTLQGWLKAINSTIADPQYDMGSDGTSTAVPARDVYGMTLGYFDGDYNRIGGSSSPEADLTGSTFGGASPSLYNGNIRHIALSLPYVGFSTIGYAYKYDQLNRLKNMETHADINYSTNAWGSGASLHAFDEAISYDENGNITDDTRNAWTGGASTIDDLHYTLNTSVNNQINYLEDNATDYGVGDILNGHTNYWYDEIGNVIQEQQSGSGPWLSYSWNVYRKLKQVTDNATGKTITFTYDPSGNRVSKSVTDADITTTTFYVNDAQGNIMATYHLDDAGNYFLDEHILYGSKRLGIEKYQMKLWDGAKEDVPAEEYYSSLTAGEKFYELTNHLGNVLATITDKRIGVDINSDAIDDYYTAELASVNDYYPFGMVMHDRSWVNSDYRFGFNGKEHDDEVKGSGNSIDFGQRIYDSRIGRFLSTDLYSSIFSYQSPYNFAGNSPIAYIDYNGNFKLKVSDETKQTYHITEQNLVRFTMILQNIGKYVNNTPKIIDLISQQSGLSPAKIKEYTHYGSGPTLNVINELGLGALAQANRAAFDKKEIDIDVRELLHLENMKIEDKDLSITIMAFVMTILHEFVHYGDRDNNLGEITGEKGNGGSQNTFSNERGYTFESSMYTLQTEYLSPAGTGLSGRFKSDFRSFNPSLTDEKIMKIFNSPMETPSQPDPSEPSEPSDPGPPSPQPPPREYHENTRFCFVKGTFITMSDGTKKPIERIMPGDKILNVDIQTSRILEDSVIDMVSPEHNCLVSITFSDGTIDKNTFDHPYYVNGKGWCSFKPETTMLNYAIEAKKLTIGDTCFKYHNGELEEVTIKKIVESFIKTKTYNISKLKYRNSFFANGILVSNESLLYPLNALKEKPSFKK